MDNAQRSKLHRLHLESRFDWERCLLGALIDNPDGLDRIEGRVNIDDFSDEFNRHLFSTITGLTLREKLTFQRLRLTHLL